MPLADFTAGLVVTRFPGSAGETVRVEHPEVPGEPVLILAEPGLPESEMQAKIASAARQLHDTFTSNQDWSLM